MKIFVNDRRRFDVAGVIDPEKRGISGYKGICKFWGWILEKIFRKAVSIQTDQGKVYLNCRSFIHWINRVNPNNSFSEKLSHRPRIVKRAICKIAAKKFQPTTCNVPVGLKNIGNSCYLNAVLQVLSQVPEIREGIKFNPEKPILKQWKELLERKTSEESESILKNLRNEIFLHAHPASFPADLGLDRKCAQQDAFEAFNFLTEMLDWRPMRLGCRFRWDDISDVQGFQKENYLSLAMEEKGQKSDLQSLICNFFKEEHIEDEAFFDIKGIRYRSDQWRKSFQISTFPEYFLLHLNRTLDYKNKITAPIVLNDTVWLPAGEKKIEYDITGLVHHHGSTLRSGHYTADVKIPDSEGKPHWFHCDDRYVTEQNPPAVSNDVYLILLKKR